MVNKIYKKAGIIKMIYHTQEVEGSTPTGDTCPNDFSDPIDQDIRTQ